MLLKNIFKKNEYPQYFIDKCIKKYLSKLFVPKGIVHNVHKNQVLLVLPFLGPLSFEIRSRLQKCFKNYIPYCSLKVVYQSRSRISNLFNFKDVVNTKLSSHIVYKFICVVATTQLIMVKLKEISLWELLGILVLHLWLVNLLKRPRNLLFLIMLLYGHKASFDNFSILLKESNLFKLQVKESLLISRDKPILNKNIYFFPL